MRHLLSASAEMSHLVHAAWNSLIEYETPRLVKIHNCKVGIVREEQRVAHSNDRRSEKRREDDGKATWLSAWLAVQTEGANRPSSRGREASYASPCNNKTCHEPHPISGLVFPHLEYVGSRTRGSRICI